MSVGEDNVLIANGSPVVYDKMENVASIITADGYEVPLSLDEDGNAVVPNPSEIEETIANGEGEWVEHPEPSAPPLPNLSEKE